jgi:hypothetical protein
MNMMLINTMEVTTGIDQVVALFNSAGKLGQRAIAFIEGKYTAPNARAFLGLSKNSKMPAYTLAIPARLTCPRGDKLAQITGTVCAGCYAMKGHDAMEPAKNAKARRLNIIKLALKFSDIRSIWKHAFSVALKKEKHFRWHSAGDIYSLEYSQLMAYVIGGTPWVKHWIPTRESRNAQILINFPNCVVRVSDDMIDQVSNKHPGNTSGVHSTDKPTRGFNCPAQTTGGSCGDCRQCWNPSVKHVSYHLH